MLVIFLYVALSVWFGFTADKFIRRVSGNKSSISKTQLVLAITCVYIFIELQWLLIRNSGVEPMYHLLSIFGIASLVVLYRLYSTIFNR